MPHWRTLVQSEYFCAADLYDEKADQYRKAIVKIVKVTQGTVVGEKGRKKGLPFLWLEDERGQALRAPFGANPTNNGFIEAALGTPDYKKWVGCWIGLYVTKVDSPKGLVDAIRVYPQRVAPPGQKGEQKSNPPASSPPATSGKQQESSDPLMDAQIDAEMSEADKRAIELAEQEEARRGR